MPVESAGGSVGVAASVGVSDVEPPTSLGAVGSVEGACGSVGLTTGSLLLLVSAVVSVELVAATVSSGATRSPACATLANTAVKKTTASTTPERAR
jgi:hypothetical protein